MKMTDHEKKLLTALERIKERLPSIRYHFKEAASHCEHLAAKYGVVKYLDLDSPAFNEAFAELVEAKSEIMSILWGLYESIGRIEYELDGVVFGLEVMRRIFNFRESTTEILGDMMMELIPACHDEDSEKLTELAEKLRKMLEKIETLIAAYSNQKGE